MAKKKSIRRQRVLSAVALYPGPTPCLRGGEFVAQAATPELDMRILFTTPYWAAVLAVASLVHGDLGPPLVVEEAASRGWAKKQVAG